MLTKEQIDTTKKKYIKITNRNVYREIFMWKYKEYIKSI